MKKTRDVKRQGEGGTEEEQQHHQQQTMAMAMAMAQCKNVAQTQSTSHGERTCCPRAGCEGGGRGRGCSVSVGWVKMEFEMEKCSTSRGSQAGRQAALKEIIFS